MSRRIVLALGERVGRFPGTGPPPAFGPLMASLGTVMAPLSVSYANVYNETPDPLNKVTFTSSKSNDHIQLTNFEATIQLTTTPKGDHISSAQNLPLAPFLPQSK